MSSLRQGNSPAHHCPQCGALLPEEAVSAAPASPSPALLRLHQVRHAAPPGSAARNSPGPGPHHPPRTSSGTGSSTVSSATAGQRPLAGGMRACCAEYGRFHRLRAALFSAQTAAVTFKGAGMYGFLEPFSMNYTGGQGPIVKNGGTWFYRAGGQSVEVPALRECADPHLCSRGACMPIIAPHHLFCLPRRRYASLYGCRRNADSTWYVIRNWLFVTYLGPFEGSPADQWQHHVLRPFLCDCIRPRQRQ